ncbi:MAG: T9SS type A sorting domain-containing protein [Chitinophagales bacterium]|nr:T9SS type A sorting domain-containing protein [Chitinophagales bacterium]
MCFYENDEVLYQDHTAQTCWLTTSTYDINQFGISVFPNPTHSSIIIQGLENLTAYQIFSSMGHEMNSGQTDSIIDVNALIPGLYYLVFSIQGKTITAIIIKQ